MLRKIKINSQGRPLRAEICRLSYTKKVIQKSLSHEPLLKEVLLRCLVHAGR